METPEYVVINPMHMKVTIHHYVDTYGPIKMKEECIENKTDIHCYYLRNIFRNDYRRGEGKADGKGKQTLVNGNVIEGEWIEGKLKVKGI